MIMKDIDTIKHHPIVEDMVDVLCNKTQNTDRGFFRVEVAYFLAKMASSMRATIVTKDRGDIPVNVYALALATSGFGKGHSINIIENDFMAGFRKRFMEDTFNEIADQHLWKLAIERAAISGKEEKAEKESLDREFSSAGALPFTFDSGTGPAVKQLRQKLLLANNGSINLQIDEIGSNLVGNVEVLNVFLELYDQGLVKQKLTKNTAENLRSEELEGKTPTNTLLFGTPSKLLDGGQTEDQFYSFLETGYARRCIFGMGIQSRASDNLTPAEIFQKLTQTTNVQTIGKIANQFAQLADINMYNWKMDMDDAVAIELLDYKIQCEKVAETYAEHEEIRKAEVSHRYFKALKLSGAFAFVDKSSEVTMDHMHAAIKLVEESGLSFQKLMTREKTYVKLARYIASTGTEVTHADLHEALPFYKSSQTARNELITLATAWGYKQHIVIKKSFIDGIEFFSGETLEETDLSKIKMSYSDHYAYDYNPDYGPFEDLHKLTQLPNMHWCNHHFRANHRAEDNVEIGFNTIVIDVDGTASLDMVHDLMQDYTFMTYTTKRHTEEENRFRLILPMRYTLNLDQTDYKEFMNNLLEWLPFKSDEAANQRSKKWQTHNGSYHYNLEGELIDPLRFVPKTSKNEHHQTEMQELESLDNLERWFAQRIANGNRNNQLIKFALALVDAGMPYLEVESKVVSFNSRLSNGLPLDELKSTILQTVAKKVS